MTNENSTASNWSEPEAATVEVEAEAETEEQVEAEDAEEVPAEEPKPASRSKGSKPASRSKGSERKQRFGTYVLEQGDNPSTVARKVLGRASRAREIVAANPRVKWKAGVEVKLP